jgi:hypothetical protein
MTRKLGLGSISSISTLAGLGLLILLAVPAFGALSPADQGAIGSAVSTSINAASAGGPSAIADAIKVAVEAQIGKYGPANAQDVAAEIIKDALAAGATPEEIGQALAEAALELGPPMNLAIADAVGSAHDADTLAAFKLALADKPGGAELIAEADAKAGNAKVGVLCMHGILPEPDCGMDSVEPGGGAQGTGGTASGSGCVDASCAGASLGS